jgi:hypothetical protein
MERAHQLRVTFRKSGDNFPSKKLSKSGTKESPSTEMDKKSGQVIRSKTNPKKGKLFLSPPF